MSLILGRSPKLVSYIAAALFGNFAQSLIVSLRALCTLLYSTTMEPCVVWGASRSLWRFLRFNWHISLYRWKINTSDNVRDIHIYGMILFTLSDLWNEVIWKFLFTCIFYIGVPFSLSSATVTPCVASYFSEKAASTWSWWRRLRTGWFCFKHGVNYMFNVF